jgi:hypothetical protein
MRGFRTSLFVAIVVLPLAPALARAAGYDELGTLERGAVDAALAARGLALDPMPEGKVVGFIHVVNLDVFQPSDGRLLEWFNHFHRTSREQYVRRESLLLPGMAYDLKLADETMRNLRNRTTYGALDPPLSSIVAMVPIKTATPGTVDVLIVTRDVWSLRFNSDYNFEPLSGNLSTLSASFSENNLFGWRKQVALAFLMDPGEMWLGPNYLDPNLLGTRLRLTAAFYEIWARKIGELAAGPREGSSSLLRLEYPFYALSRRWGGFVQGAYTNRMVRTITTAGANFVLERYLPATDPASGGQCIPPSSAPGDPYPTLTAECAYRSRTGGITSGITRSFPRAWLIQRVTVGNEFNLNRLSFLPGFPADPVLRNSFYVSHFRPSERTSSLYLQYDAFTPRYHTYRNLDTYDLGEDMRLGPSVTLKFGRASTLLGSEADFFLFRTEAHVNLALFGGFQSVGLSWESRDYSNGLLDQLFSGQFYAASPVLARSLRIVASGVAAIAADNVHRPLVYVGGLQGLRGYPIDYFSGHDYYLGHLELRSMPLTLASLRVGGLAFADVGDAAERVRADPARDLRGLELYSDVGVGVRVLIPQLNADVLRCDWAIPLKDVVRENRVLYQAGWPGRIYCGFHQAF